MTVTADKLRQHAEHLRAAPDVSDRVLLEDLAAAMADICEILVVMRLEGPQVQVAPQRAPGLHMNDDTLQIWWQDQEIVLQRLEYVALKALVRRCNKTVPHEELMELTGHTKRNVLAIVNSLKTRFVKISPGFKHIRNCFGKGYYWSEY